MGCTLMSAATSPTMHNIRIMPATTDRLCFDVGAARLTVAGGIAHLTMR